MREDIVTIERGIAGVLAAPVHEGPSPAVLLCHGFGNAKDEVGDLFKRLAETLANRGVASLRFDFRGWGDSEGFMADTTIQGQLEDAQAAYAYLASRDEVDSDRIGVLGFSLGAATALMSADAHPGWYRSMALWSPPDDLTVDFLEGFGQEYIDTAATEGIVTIDLGWRDVTLKHAFFESLPLYRPWEAISRYDGALLAIAGSEDSSAAVARLLVEQTPGTPKEALIIPGADHIFGVLDDDRGSSDLVIDATARWFARTLVDV